VSILAIFLEIFLPNRQSVAMPLPVYSRKENQFVA
jgi:hypothetical protein